MAVSHLRNLFSHYSNKPSKRRTSPDLQPAVESTKRRQHSVPYEGNSPSLAAGRFSSSRGRSDPEQRGGPVAQLQPDRSWLWDNEKSQREDGEFKTLADGASGPRTRRESGASVKHGLGDASQQATQVHRHGSFGTTPTTRAPSQYSGYAANNAEPLSASATSPRLKTDALGSVVTHPLVTSAHKTTEKLSDSDLGIARHFVINGGLGNVETNPGTIQGGVASISKDVVLRDAGNRVKVSKDNVEKERSVVPPDYLPAAQGIQKPPVQQTTAIEKVVHRAGPNSGQPTGSHSGTPAGHHFGTPAGPHSGPPVGQPPAKVMPRRPVTTNPTKVSQDQRFEYDPYEV